VARSPFTFGHFAALARCEPGEAELLIVEEYDAALSAVCAGLPAPSVLVVYTRNGNLKRFRANVGADGLRVRLSEDPVRGEKFQRCRQSLLWVSARNV
jgi:hypothetical protein